MKSKIILHAFLYPHSLMYLTPEELNDPEKVGPHLQFAKDMSHYKETVPMGEVEIEIELPTHDQIVQGAVAAMRVTQARVKAEAHAEHEQIETRINNMLALPAPEAKG
jgi:hypothetical protein